MTRADLLNTVKENEKLADRHPNHQANSRRKHLTVSYLAEATDEALAAYNKHLEDVIAAGVAVQIVADALSDVQLDDGARRRIRKLVDA